MYLAWNSNVIWKLTCVLINAYNRQYEYGTRQISVTNDYGHVPFVVITIRSVHHSRLIIRFVVRATLRCVVCCTSLSVILSFFFRPLRCTSIYVFWLPLWYLQTYYCCNVTVTLDWHGIYSIWNFEYRTGQVYYSLRNFDFTWTAVMVVLGFIVYRHVGERHTDLFAVQRLTFDGGNAMVLGDIAARWRTPLVIMDGNLNGMRYHDEILQQRSCYSIRSQSNAIKFRQCNVRLHVAHVLMNFLAYTNVSILHRLDGSSVLSPSEHMWWDGTTFMTFTRLTGGVCEDGTSISQNREWHSASIV